MGDSGNVVEGNVERRKSINALRKIFKKVSHEASVYGHNNESFQLFGGTETPEELTVTRFKFDPVKETFVKDEVKILLEKDALSVAIPGAMREIFRCKIMSKFKGSSNYVAKKYREHVEAADEMYFTDCKMQMIAKKLSEEFNLLKPPHRIDFLECFVISVPPDATQTKPQLYCCERFIAGDYEKHSGNNGFVQLTHHRMTPHAFSHFTYVKSGGRRMVVDIQGVSDLWTDPQIHTLDDANDYGLGNMGITGMAKFFRSYNFNPLCEWIGLTPFAQSPGDGPAVMDWAGEAKAHASAAAHLAHKGNPFRTQIAGSSAKLGADVHFEMARMYEDGRFNDKPDPDLASAVYHVQVAAQMGLPAANVIMAKVYSGVARDVLRDHKVTEDPDTSFNFWLSAAKGGDLNAMFVVAQYYESVPGFVAPKAHKSYKNAAAWLHKLVQNHEMLEDDDHHGGDEEEEFEMHNILARLAGMYGEGGHGLQQSNPKAAELFTEAAGAAEVHMKAKLAAKYYERAEEFEGDEEEDSTTSSAPDIPTGMSSFSSSFVSTPHLTPQHSSNTLALNPAMVGETGKMALSRWVNRVSDLDSFDHVVGGFLQEAIQISLDSPGSSSLSWRTAESDAALHAKLRSLVDSWQSLAATQSALNFEDSVVGDIKPWVLSCPILPHKEETRLSLEAQHQSFIRTYGGNIMSVTMLLSDSGEPYAIQYKTKMSRDGVDAFLKADPLHAAGVYAEVSITEAQVTWRNPAI